MKYTLLIAALLIGCGPGGGYVPLHDQTESNDMISWNGDSDEMIVWDDYVYNLADEPDMELEADEEDSSFELPSHGFSSCASE